MRRTNADRYHLRGYVDLPFRELLRLNESLQTIRGHLELNLAGFHELDKKIEQKHEEIRAARLVDSDDAVRCT